jgi:hypothetical protein
MQKSEWIVVYKTEEAMLADGYEQWEMDMSTWYTKEGFPVLWPIHGGYGHRNGAPIWTSKERKV